MFKLSQLLLLKHTAKNDILRVIKLFESTLTHSKINYSPQKCGVLPSAFDVVIVGAGAIGSSTAFWLKQKAGSSINILVIDRDLTYKAASTVLSVGGLRQQFSLKENVQLSSFGGDFIENIKLYLGDSVDVQFTSHGYLSLASENGKKILKENHETQLRWGSTANELLSPSDLGDRFPWLNTEGIALGCLGSEREGWFDPWCYLLALRKRAKELGVWFVEAVPCEFSHSQIKDISSLPDSLKDQHKLNGITIKTSEGQIKRIPFKTCIIAAGADTGRLTKDLLNLDQRNSGSFQYEVPVERRKRYVYCFKSFNEMVNVGSPMIIDPSGIYVRREGVANSYICGCSPSEEEEPSTDNLDVDYDYFNEQLWPVLAHRIPSFEALKLTSAWAGYYDYNSFDQNAIIGFHPAYQNMILEAGFSGHGLQHSPGVGRGVAELLLNGKFQTIDLECFNFKRVIRNKPMIEHEII